jgi:hypothetical protein
MIPWNRKQFQYFCVNLMSEHFEILPKFIM